MQNFIERIEKSRDRLREFGLITKFNYREGLEVLELRDSNGTWRKELFAKKISGDDITLWVTTNEDDKISNYHMSFSCYADYLDRVISFVESHIE